MKTETAHRRRGSGGIVRKLLRQLEEAGLVEKMPRKGRVLSPKGRSLLDRVAREVVEELVKVRPELAKYL